MPEPKSISELPSTSTSTPPPAAVMNTGRTWLSPRATLRWRALEAARARPGPGISVTSSAFLRQAGTARAGHLYSHTGDDKAPAARLQNEITAQAPASQRLRGPVILTWSMFTEEQAVRTQEGLFAGIFGRGGVGHRGHGLAAGHAGRRGRARPRAERAGLAAARRGRRGHRGGAGGAFDAAELGRQAAATGNPVPPAGPGADPRGPAPVAARRRAPGRDQPGHHRYRRDAAGQAGAGRRAGRPGRAADGRRRAWPPRTGTRSWSAGRCCSRPFRLPSGWSRRAG